MERVHGIRGLEGPHRGEADASRPVRSFLLDGVIADLPAAARVRHVPADVAVQLQDTARSEGHVYRRCVHGIQHVTVADDLHFRPVSWRRLLLHRRLEPRRHSGDVLDAARGLHALDAGHLHKGVKHDGSRAPVQVLPALVLTNQAHGGEQRRRDAHLLERPVPNGPRAIITSRLPLNMVTLWLPDCFSMISCTPGLETGDDVIGTLRGWKQLASSGRGHRSRKEPSSPSRELGRAELRPRYPADVA